MPSSPKLLLVFAASLLLATGCETTPDGPNLGEDGSGQPQLTWKLWGEKVVLLVNHVPYEVFQGADSYEPLLPQQFPSYGVPEEALAATFVMSTEPDESNNYGIYVAQSGTDLIIYRTAYDPGFLHNPRWERLSRIPLAK